MIDVFFTTGTTLTFTAGVALLPVQVQGPGH